MRFERREIAFVHRIGAGVPISLGAIAALAPEAVFRPEDQPEPIAGIGECGMMRIVRAANKVESRLLDQSHIALARRLRDGNAPAGVILVSVGAAQVKMFAVEKKATICGPLEPTKAEFSLGGL